MSNLKIITGHFGSGKTEFCLNYAINSARKNPTTLIDIDIVNPYFRSREQASLLEGEGVRLVGGSLGLSNVSADLPALPAEIYGHIDERFDTVILDVGGDASGARVLSRFSPEISSRDYDMYIVVNANRPFTQTPEAVIRYINDIEATSRLHIQGIINNTHLLRETSLDDINRGIELCKKVEEMSGKALIYNVVPDFLNLQESEGIIDKIFRLKVYMRPDWL